MSRMRFRRSGDRERFPDAPVEGGLLEVDEIKTGFKTERGLVRAGLPVKVLARGDIGAAITVRAHAFSDAARAKIEAAGGKAEVLG